jgi:hypothetical protein
MNRPMILVGCWPRRMCAELAATYCAFRADVFARERRPRWDTFGNESERFSSAQPVEGCAQ